MLATSPLRHARITMILLSVSMTLLLLRNNCIFFYQSSNFVWSLSNYPGSRTILLGTTTYTFSLISTGATNISSSDHSFISSKASFVIFNNPSLSDSASISFILYKLILSLCGLHHTCFICLPAITLSNHSWTNYYIPFLLQGELFNTLPNVMILG